jgi:hypothetical protein
MRPPNDVIWNRIRAFQGTPFQTIKGLPFDYLTDGNGLFIFRDGKLVHRRLTRSNVLKAADRCPLSGPTEIGDCLGPSYIFGILMDQRVRQELW